MCFSDVQCVRMLHWEIFLFITSRTAWVYLRHARNTHCRELSELHVFQKKKECWNFLYWIARFFIWYRIIVFFVISSTVWCFWAFSVDIFWRCVYSHTRPAWYCSSLHNWDPRHRNAFIWDAEQGAFVWGGGERDFGCACHSVSLSVCLSCLSVCLSGMLLTWYIVMWVKVCVCVWHLMLLMLKCVRCVFIYVYTRVHICTYTHVNIHTHTRAFTHVTHIHRLPTWRRVRTRCICHDKASAPNRMLLWVNLCMG